jgi:hypothetical protein
VSTGLEELYSCNLTDNWIWAQGHWDKRKFKGACLSAIGRFDSDFDKEQILKGKVKHGWAISIVGDTSGCGWDVTMHLEDTKPEVIDGRWHHHTVLNYDDDDNETEEDAEVADGPHEATWIELG